MDDDSTVNSQITDSINQVNTSTLGHSPAQSMGIIDAVMAETLGMAMHNAVSAQQNSQMVGAAAVTSACAKMLAVPVAKPPKPVTPPKDDPKNALIIPPS